MARRIRYVRDHASGSQFGASSFWQEIRVLDAAGTVLSNSAIYTIPVGTRIDGGGTTLPAGVMNDVASTGYEISVDGVSGTAGAVSVMCDLGSLQMVETVRICRYASGVFQGTKTEVSEDGVRWLTLRDSAVQGTYTEALPGLDMRVPGNTHHTLLLL